MPCNVVVLISGSGSNLQALIDSVAHDGNPARIAAVICNRAGAYGLERAKQAGIATELLDHKQFDGREAFDAALIQAIDAHQPDLVVLAGFMRILTPGFVQHYAGRLLNIHPSLLPKHKGLHTHQRAIEAGDSEHGCSVHFVTEELDGGPLVVQAVLPVMADDTAESLAQRVHQQEHQIYPLAVRWFAEGRLRLGAQGAMLDGQPLPASGHLIRT
ncbi:phosphoribosylglycinamide formyltransferase [Pseudomonas sp. MDMC216]|jgi:phosphoribosylglycinamide formyltransferase-1|uniref:Phosphoribosylglycinamide formyltransferase n=1 Tax=Ectopseudomonas chengduensis TaxID=489632 RepID=A0A1G6N823_9GAMM|nr:MULTISPECIES: phosphoribosylglycinamide formyltransferase [Pseudomonas]KJU78102.1 phosphoribosylglycinamide formyltransferase [Pseudomonas oleovorans]ERH49373.1 phosphoribosylglycinamide formyltransferase [Pseudomonas chengduensis]KQO31314.1 phosphoribosylglycinamide formyltransferase [Pseudomonas sp. Leaf83]MBP3061598.1 phosphoribosylglycinamide formyltransferase [Pseudomonas chengduensis]MDH0960234.1 phosphoribosylglycinamide formyltransferase [Pseudomonas chengduensis]